MKVLLLNVNWRLERPRYYVDTTLPPVCFPMEWGYLFNDSSSHVFLDEYAANRPITETVKAVRFIEPQIVYISTAPSYLYWRCPPLNLDVVFKYINEIKKEYRLTKVIVIGPHGTTDPGWIFRKCSADFVFRGEPDGNLDLNFASSELDAIPWLATRYDYKAIAPQRSFEKIGRCNYSLVNSYDYEPHAWGEKKQAEIKKRLKKRFSLVELTRGCPFDCQYCFRSGFRNTYRKKPLSLFEEEVTYLKSNDIRYVFFIDETFGLDWDHATGAIEMLNKHEVRFGIQSRPDVLTNTRIENLAIFGCDYIEFGLESNELACLEALNKFKDNLGVLATVEFAKQKIKHVNVNILDLTNSDYVENPPNIIQHDNCGFIAPPLIPYPNTTFGERAMDRHRADVGDCSKWEIAEDIFFLYSYKSGFIKQSEYEAILRSRGRQSVSIQQNKSNGHEPLSSGSRFERLFKKN